MRAELAIFIMNERVKEHGAKEYEIHLRHFSIGARDEVKIQSNGDIWILVDEQYIYNAKDPVYPAGTALKIESDNGIYDVFNLKQSEFEHEHSGEIVVTNLSNADQHFFFLQATPKNKKHDTEENGDFQKRYAGENQEGAGNGIR